MYDLSGLGARIRMLRMEKGLTQDGFARELGVSAQAVSKWETGAGFPDIGTLPMIADVLGTSIDALFGDTEREAAEAEPLPREPVPGEVQPVFVPADPRPDAADKEEDFDEDEDDDFDEDEDEDEDDEEDEEDEDPGDGDDPDRGPAHEETRNSSYKGYGDPFEKRDWAKWGAEWGDRITRQVEDSVRSALQNTDFSRFSEFGKTVNSRMSELGDMISRTVNEAISRQAAGAPSPEDGALVWNGESIDSLELNLNSSAEVTVEPGTPGQWNVTAEGCEEFLNSIRCIEDGNVLKIEMAPFRNRLHRREKNTLTVYTGYTEGIELDAAIRGSGSLSCAPSFQSSRVSIAGSGDMELADAGNLTAQINGSGDLAFRTASNLNLTIRGSGDAEGDTVGGVSEIKVYGSGDVSLRQVTGQLSCMLFGSGDVELGSAVLDKFSVTSNGAGDVSVSGGRAAKLELSMHGAGDFDGDGLTVDELDVGIHGAARATIGRLIEPYPTWKGRPANLRILQQD